MHQKNVFHKKIDKKVNKQNIQNSENWLFDDVSEIEINFKDEVKTLSEIFPPFKKIMSNRPLQVYQDLQQVPLRVIVSRLQVRLKLCLM